VNGPTLVLILVLSWRIAVRIGDRYAPRPGTADTHGDDHE
jgi:hypothetical protein